MSAKDAVPAATGGGVEIVQRVPAKMLICWCCWSTPSTSPEGFTTDRDIGWCRSCRDGRHARHVHTNDSYKTIYDVYFRCMECVGYERETMTRGAVDAMLFAAPRDSAIEPCWCGEARTIEDIRRRNPQPTDRGTILDVTPEPMPKKPEPLLAACYRKAGAVDGA